MSLPMGEIRSAFHYRILKSCSRKETISVFRWQKIFICNSICEKRFTIAFGVTDFSDADKESVCRPPTCKHVSQNSCWEASWPVNHRRRGDACQREKQGLLAEVKTS